MRDTKYYAFVIDTDSYAGNFERQLALYITGVEVEYMHGGMEWLTELAAKEVDELPKEVIEDVFGRSEFGPFDDQLHDVVNDTGAHTYVEIFESPGSHSNYNSVAIYLDEQPDQKLVKLMKQRAKAFLSIKKPKGDDGSEPEKFKILGFRVLELKSTSRTLKTLDN
jgi:hypothetical protein